MKHTQLQNTIAKLNISAPTPPVGTLYTGASMKSGNSRMKIIIYILIAIFAFGIFARSFANQAGSEARILIQSEDKKITSSSLSKSAKIIEDRLKDFGSERAEVKVIPENGQIQVTLADNKDHESVVKLLTQQGSLSFYATWNKESLSCFLNGDNHLFALFSAKKQNKSNEILGCTTDAEVGTVNNYLKTLSPDQKYKFVWSQPSSNGEVCLYALRLENHKGSLLSGSDIKNATFNQDKASGTYNLDIEFKKSAVQIWANASRLNTNKVIAIVSDNKVIYAPLLKSAIEGGKCSVSGNLTEKEVRYFAALCNNGELPVRFNVIK